MTSPACQSPIQAAQFKRTDNGNHGNGSMGIATGWASTSNNWAYSSGKMVGTAVSNISSAFLAIRGQEGLPQNQNGAFYMDCLISANTFTGASVGLYLEILDATNQNGYGVELLMTTGGFSAAYSGYISGGTEHFGNLGASGTWPYRLGIGYKGSGSNITVNLGGSYMLEGVTPQTLTGGHLVWQLTTDGGGNNSTVTFDEVHAYVWNGAEGSPE